eukprot:3842125-Alexandrium_andersonii.AAC.1
MELALLRCSRHRAPSVPVFVGGFRISASSHADLTRRELLGLIFRPFMRLRSSCSERLLHFSMFCRCTV